MSRGAVKAGEETDPSNETRPCTSGASAAGALTESANTKRVPPAMVTELTWVRKACSTWATVPENSIQPRPEGKGAT